MKSIFASKRNPLRERHSHRVIGDVINTMHKLTLCLSLLLIYPPPCLADTPAQDTQASAAKSADASIVSTRRAPQGITPSTEASFFSGTILKGIGYSLAAGLLAISLLKRFSGTRANGQVSDLITILARKYVGPKTALLIAQVEDKHFFLAQCGDDIKLLSLIETTADPENNLSDYFERSSPDDLEMEDSLLMNRR